MKNKHPRPAKGQLPDPTYSRMKFAFRTDGADSDGKMIVKKKKPRVEVPGLSWKGFLTLFPCMMPLPPASIQGLGHKCKTKQNKKANASAINFQPARRQLRLPSRSKRQGIL